MPNSRKYNWVHNSLLGSATRSRVDWERIMSAKSATPKAKALAQKIINLQFRLAVELGTKRVDQDGTVIYMKEKS